MDGWRHSHISNTPNHRQNGVCILILLYVVLRCYRLADAALRPRMEMLTFTLLALDVAYVLGLKAVKGKDDGTIIMEDIIG